MCIGLSVTSLFCLFLLAKSAIQRHAVFPKIRTDIRIRGFLVFLTILWFVIFFPILKALVLVAMEKMFPNYMLLSHSVEGKALDTLFFMRNQTELSIHERKLAFFYALKYKYTLLYFLPI
jgi:hypothetical protein